MGSSMVIVNPNGNGTREYNTVFGNAFGTSPIAYNYSFYRVLAFNTTYTGGPNVGSLGVFASGNTIYNNIFATPITAYSPPQNPYLAYVFINDFGYTDFAGVAATWSNHWNISAEPQFHVRVVNGFPLTGSVVSAPFQGGNAWTNWNGSIPYTDQGLIVGGGDSLPLPLPGAPMFAVVFEEFGLPHHPVFTVTLNGVTYRSIHGMIVVYEAPGTYAFTVHHSHHDKPNPASGSVTVSTYDVYVAVQYS
jgi:thermopsin